jgi:hypothetical protein
VIACLSKARAAGDEKEIGFFEQAARVLQSGPLKVLRISDSNTTGLIGPPEIPGTPFHSLVKGSGVSKKLDPASGGSFGIGKNAVYAISDLQTVFYSTFYSEVGGQQFLAQGKTILVSHQGRDGVPRRPTGYWGLPGFRPISDPSQAPAWLRRHDQGTSVYALGFRETQDWEHRIASALLKNFFHAIHTGEMEFAIDDNRIVLSRANVGSLFEDPEIIAAAEMSDQKQSYDFSRDLFRCLTSSDAKEHETTIRGLGRVSVRVLVADGLPKKVGIIRNGMMITDSLEFFGDKFARFQMHRDFVALVVPLDAGGRAFIKKLENPKHDSLSAEWLADETRRAAAKGIMKQLVKFIRDTIKSHSLAQFEDEVSADELEKYFAVESQAATNPAQDGQDDLATVRYTIEPKKQRTEPRASSRGQGDTGGERRGRTYGLGPGPSPGENPRPRSRGTGGAGEARPIYLADTRNFVPSDNNPKTRTILFTPSEGGTATILLEASGLSENEPLKVVRASGATILAGQIVAPVIANQRIRMDVEFDEPYVGPVEIHASVEPEAEAHLEVE